MMEGAWIALAALLHSPKADIPLKHLCSTEGQGLPA